MREAMKKIFEKSLNEFFSKMTDKQVRDFVYSPYREALEDLKGAKHA